MREWSRVEAAVADGVRVGRAVLQKAPSRTESASNLELQQSLRGRDSGALAAAEQGTSGAGGGLPYQASIQRSFGHHDISRARAHVGGAASAAADALDASAYTVGDQVAFAGAPSLHTAAHEAAHVVQQRAGVQLDGGVGQAGDRYERHADAVADRVVRGEPSGALLDEVAPATASGETRGVQRAPKFAPLYGANAATDAEAYKDTIGGGAVDRPAEKPASQWEKNGKTGTKVGAFRMSKSEILDVIAYAESAIAVDHILGPPGTKDRTDHEDQIANYVSKMTEAFEIMQIDTIEAQADFVAHSVGETLLSKLTEAQTKTFVDDPTKVSVSTDLTTDPKSGTILGPRRYKGKGLIDPGNVITQTGPMDAGLFRQTFIGRGPIQVTDRTNYMHSLMYLELRADQLQQQLDGLPATSPERAKLTAEIALLREAVDKISADPSLAADPKYAFLFSAAFMQSSSALRDSIAGFGPTHDFTKSAGFSGGFIDDRGKVKTKAYEKAYQILSSHITPGEFVDSTWGKIIKPLGPSPWAKDLESPAPSSTPSSTPNP